MIHEKFPEYFPSGDTTVVAKAAAVKRANHIICVSENTRQDLIEILGTDPNKTSVVPLGFSFTNIDGVKTKPTEKTKDYLLYVGDRKGYKNFDILLQAYSLSVNLRNNFDIVLFGGDTGLTWEIKRAHDLGIKRECLRLAQGDDSILASHYSSASLFVYPSIYEGFGIPPLEAMALRCPVVCSNAGPLPEVVGDAAEMFDPHSPESLLAAIEVVLHDRGRREALIKKGVERTQLFSWEVCAKQTMAVYEKVLL
jgi:glycosyltransferase involved in cell wall biosynthesis